jgi:hypothetical protein
MEIEQNSAEVEQQIFVDHCGRRRRLVIAAGLVVATALITWLALMVVSVVAAVASGAPSPVAAG